MPLHWSFTVPQSLTILCSSPGWGGLEMNTVKLAASLRARGWAVSVLGVEGSPFLSAAAKEGFGVAAIAPNTGPRTLLRAARIAGWMRAQGSALLLTPFNKDIAAAALARRLFRRPARLVYQQHMKVGVPKRDPIHTWRYAALDAWIAPLEYLRKEVLEKTRVPAERLHVVPFGIDVDYFAKAPLRKEEARALLALPPGVPMLGVLGRLDPKKGQDFLVRALPLLEEQTGVRYHGCIAGAATVGEGSAYEERLRAFVQSLGLEGRVHFRPAAEDVRPFYRAVDVFCLPSDGETFGMVTLEALASGLPVVGTARDGTAEILADMPGAALYEPGDVDGFCRAVQGVRALPVLEDNARASLLEKYSEVRMLEAVGAVLAEIVGPLFAPRK